MASKVVVFRGPAANGSSMIIGGTRVPCTGGAFYVPEKLVKSFIALPHIAAALKAGRLKRLREVPPAAGAAREEPVEQKAEPATPATSAHRKKE